MKLTTSNVITIAVFVFALISGSVTFYIDSKVTTLQDKLSSLTIYVDTKLEGTDRVTDNQQLAITEIRKFIFAGYHK